jgi:enoyl-[acyl-carrier protein] reductase I
MLKRNAERAPLKRNVTIDEVGNSAMFLCSDLASGITAQTIYVDAGFNSCAMSLDEMDDKAES